MKCGWAIVLLALLTGCGPDITYHFDTTKEEMKEITHDGSVRLGYTTWETYDYLVDDGIKSAHIYLLSKSEFPNPRCWNETIRHEERHAYNGSFHSDTGDSEVDYPDLPNCWNTLLPNFYEPEWWLEPED